MRLVIVCCLFLGALGCYGRITPAIKEGTTVTVCRLIRYTAEDSLLSKDQRDLRIDTYKRHAALVGADVSQATCEEVGR